MSDEAERIRAAAYWIQRTPYKKWDKYPPQYREHLQRLADPDYEKINGRHS
jgi:hypothetical protein